MLRLARHGLACGLAWLPDESSSICRHLDHNGNPYGSATSANVGNNLGMGPLDMGHGAHVPCQPMPTLQELGIEDAIKQLSERVQESQDTYVIKLSQSYCVTQYDPPRGPCDWECEMVMLTIKLASVRNLVLQLSAGELDKDGYAIVTATSIGGDERCSVRLSVEDNNVSSLLAILANECRHEERTLSLVFPNGTSADSKSGDLKLAALFNLPRARRSIAASLSACPLSYSPSPVVDAFPCTEPMTIDHRPLLPSK